VDLNQFTPGRQLSAFGSPSRRFRLLFVGNPSLRKGADLLPALAEELGNGFEIACLGGLRSVHGGVKKAANLSLLPSVPSGEMPAVYQAADAVLIPTRYEAFGYVALEAMACGVPVIGFEAAGTAEVCVNGETALLAPLNDVSQLAEYARRLQSDAQLRARLGAAARKRAECCFSPKAAIDSYLDIYRRVL